MASLDRVVHVHAPAAVVWETLNKLPNAGSIHTIKNKGLFIEQSGNKTAIYFVYRRPDGSTRLRHLMTNAKDVFSLLLNAPDTPAALATLPGNISEEEVQAAEMHLREIVQTAEAEALPFKPAEVVITAEKRAPFSRHHILLAAALFSILCSGMMTAVNWRRLGKPQRYLAALLFSGIALIAETALLTMFALMWDQITQYIALALGNVVLTIPLMVWQQPEYDAWVDQHGGHPSLSQAGYGGCIIIILASTLLGVFLLATLSALLGSI